MSLKYAYTDEEVRMIRDFPHCVAEIKYEYSSSTKNKKNEKDCYCLHWSIDCQTGEFAHQEGRLRKYCMINEIDVIKVYCEDHSAKIFDRPAFKEMMHMTISQLVD